jgi:hypothetical protein
MEKSKMPSSEMALKFMHFPITNNQQPSNRRPMGRQWNVFMTRPPILINPPPVPDNLGFPY